MFLSLEFRIKVENELVLCGFSVIGWYPSVQYTQVSQTGQNATTIEREVERFDSIADHH